MVQNQHRLHYRVSDSSSRTANQNPEQLLMYKDYGFNKSHRPLGLRPILLLRCRRAVSRQGFGAGRSP
jgi:hypothetical protein